MTSRSQCTCIGEDADAAAQALRTAAVIESFVHESHFSVSLRRCGACGRVFLRIFTELIDWQGGNDSQAWISTPLNGNEAEALRSGGDWEGFISRMRPDHRYLAQVYPRSGDGGASWRQGKITILPHD